MNCRVNAEGSIDVWGAHGLLPGQVMKLEVEDVERLEELVQQLKLEALAETLVLEVGEDPPAKISLSDDPLTRAQFHHVRAVSELGKAVEEARTAVQEVGVDGP